MYKAVLEKKKRNASIDTILAFQFGRGDIRVYKQIKMPRIAPIVGEKSSSSLSLKSSYYDNLLTLAFKSCHSFARKNKKADTLMSICSFYGRGDRTKLLLRKIFTACRPNAYAFGT